MATTKNERKNKAIELMRKLDIYKPYIKGFDENDHVCFFERFGGFWVYQEPEIEEKMKAIEARYNCTVYAITHEIMEFGECFSFLIVPDYKDVWDDIIYTEDNIHYACAYVWNKNDNFVSGLSRIGVRSFGGGIARVA